MPDIRIVHVINPVKLGEASDLFKAQPVTFASMERARQELTSPSQVHFHACCYPEDEEMIPAYFDSRAILKRSVQDISSFKKSRKLPLISDIITSIPEQPFDYLIYTNVDISLMPNFYQEVIRRIEEGREAFIINRRTISTDYDTPENLDRMFAQAGELHPGLDCFVMSKKVVENAVFGDAIIGTTFIGKVLELNCRVLSNDFQLYTQDHLTFHLGDDRSWRNPELEDYVDFNKKEFRKVIDALLPIAKEKKDKESLGVITDYLYRIYDWNEDGKNPYLNPPTAKKPDWSTRIKRSIGALMGNT